MSTSRNALASPSDTGGLGCALEWLPQAVIVVDADSAVASLNLRAAQLLARADGLALRGQVLRCTDTRDVAILHRLVSEAAGLSWSGTPPRGMRIRRAEGRRSLTALVTPADGDRTTPLGARRVVVLVNDPEQQLLIDEHMLRTWYDLTPAEARVACLLAAGLSLEAIGTRLRVGANTVRTQLKSIFSKTDTCRQGELISLLLGNPTLGGIGQHSRRIINSDAARSPDVAVSRRSA